ncbi:MAG: sialate O-acetylesterase [Dyadobacter sp.]
MVHSFLMIGQSNMAGRGFVKDVAPIYDEHIKVLINGCWQTMTEPMNHDRPMAGISLAASFAGAWRLQNPQEEIGLIPCADGGTSLDDWAVGGALFENAVFHAKLAQRVSSLDGILWHQGENDSFSGLSGQYYEKLAVIVDAFRQELNVIDIPFIAGGLGDFLSSGRYGQYFTEYQAVNKALLDFATTKPNSYFVGAAGLSANPDDLHFNAISLRLFGIRYFNAWNYRKNILEAIVDEEAVVDVITSRTLTKTESMSLLKNGFAGGKLSVEEFDLAIAELDKS